MGTYDWGFLPCTITLAKDQYLHHVELDVSRSAYNLTFRWFLGSKISFLANAVRARNSSSDRCRAVVKPRSKKASRP